MAFCKFCGKEIADGAVCDCQASQAQTPINNNQSTSDFDSASSQSGASAAQDPLKLLIAAVVALLVLIFVLVFLFNNFGAKGVAKKYAKKSIAKRGAKAYYSMILSDEVYKDLKGGDLDDMIDKRNDDRSDYLDDVKISLKSVKKTKKLSKTQLNGAEVLFAKQNKPYDKSIKSDDFKAKKGYEFKLTYKVKDKDSGEKETLRLKICVVKFKKEGWKVLAVDGDKLKSAAPSKSSSKDKDIDDYIDDYVDDYFD